ncbi:DegT/DnrJ/EryC1/StrS family aminotransferase [Sulfuricystis multivorans]|uniref:DegT/DnrJ/EryC1/StrS family aminotransferase n=1 Tax=Sulfuricystis multivorans TaxID=2211108 RepID=UPI000F828531|nr:DegT/DnrJ/EryC1/StrS family aminotransferase [Sulfuricystis multivorans]
MLLDTLIFDPSSCGFPRPRLPLLPIGFDGIAFAAPSAWAPTAHFRHFSRGRYALREAYRLAGIGPGSTLLAPAYHCRTMLDPALALGADVALYPLRSDLSPDLAALDALADSAPIPVRALLATHFFGLPRDFAALADWCAARRITLIEDASHAFFTEQHRPAGIGAYGAFVVSSPYKFLPSPDGGLLYAPEAGRLHDIVPRAPSWRDELAGIASFWQKAHSASRCDLAMLEAELTANAANPSPLASERHEFAGPSSDYRPEHAGRASLRLSRLLYRHPDIAAIASSRRKNYRRWTTATMNLPYCRPLYPELPDDCIPYMFPLLIEHPETHFYWLKRLGVPIWRWDSMAASTCPTATHYRLHLLHLPCHQSLNESKMDWIISALTKVGAGRTALLQACQ